MNDIFGTCLKLFWCDAFKTFEYSVKMRCVEKPNFFEISEIGISVPKNTFRNCYFSLVYIFCNINSHFTLKSASKCAFGHKKCLASSGILKESYIFKLIYWITDMINGEYFCRKDRAVLFVKCMMAQSQIAKYFYKCRLYFQFFM